MEYADSVNQLATDFINNPIEYGTEADLRARLHQLLSEELEALGQRFATVADPRLVGETRAYKQPYKDVVERQFRDRGSLSRVRFDVSIGKRQQYDIAVFDNTIDHPVEWIRSGSKRFNEHDLDAAFGIKFIKNKCYPPTQCPITDASILEMDSTELQTVLNTKENNLLGDFEELRALPDSVDTFFVLVSNNNYLFDDPLTEIEQRERKKRRIGTAAREWLRKNAAGIDVLYIHPRGSNWITNGQEVPV